MPEKRIKNLMVEMGSLRCIPPRAKVADAVNMLDEKQQNKGLLPFLLVVDEVGKGEEILGILSIHDILDHMGRSTECREELPIFWRGQFMEECKATLQKSAGEIMSHVTHVIDQNATLMEALHLMNCGKVDWLPVVEKEEVVGILFKKDLFNEVFAVAQKETHLSESLS